VLWAAVLPLLLVFAYLRIDLGGAQAMASARTATTKTGATVAECTFPGTGAQKQRLVIGIVDSLRADTALDPEVMPWLASHKNEALWGYMQPCLSQLSLLCFRTIFEGSEPLLVTGFHNFSGMKVQAPSLVNRLAARGIRVAAVADQAFIKLYRPSLAVASMFEERPSGIDRDAFGRAKTFEWLADPSLDVIISHVIDTDATAHRAGVGAPDYVAKFREADGFLHDVSSRLGPRDSMLILGDHGHNLQGHHSSGIPATTAFFASGPLFPKGRREDSNMATAYFFAGAVTCEATPVNYTGRQPFAALNWSESTREAFRAASPAPMQQASSGFDVFLDVPALAVGLGLLVLLLGALGGSVTPAMLLTATLGLAAAFLMPLSAILGITTVGVGAIGFARKPVDRRAIGLLTLALAIGLAGGLLAARVVVTLQDHVNPVWTLSFWAGLVALITLASPASRRIFGLPKALGWGFTAWGIMLYGLFLGPYYYGAIRMLPFSLVALLVGLGALASASERRLLLPWLAVAVLPLVPILFPEMKEWNPRWILLGFVQGRGPVVAAAASLGALGAAVAATRDLRAWRKTAIAVVVLVVIGIATQLAEWTLLGSVLVLLAYTGWTQVSARLSNLHPANAWLTPIGQASFALVLFFVLLGGYRFANVDFRFALALTPMEAGEGHAAAIALPLCIIKYLGPLGLLFWIGPAVDGRAAALVLLKLLVLGAGLLGMELSGAPSLALFRQLQSQELALCVMVYISVALAYSVKPAKNASARPATPRQPEFRPPLAS
jgi:hypothetical protein